MNEIRFWHGWAMSQNVWQPLITQLKLLTDENTNFYTQSLPGYGSTPFLSDHQQWAQTLLSDATRAQILCGWSMGAILALQAAIEVPEKVKAIIVFGATPAFAEHDNWSCAVSSLVEKQFERELKRHPQQLLKRFPALFCRHDKNEKAIIRSLESQSEPDIQTLSAGLTYLHETDLRSHIDKIKQPVLLIHGTLDPLMPTQAAVWLKENLPNSHLHMMEDTAHCAFLSSTQTCAELIGDFIEQNA